MTHVGDEISPLQTAHICSMGPKERPLLHVLDCWQLVRLGPWRST